jgi:hypothetical protein
MHEITKILSELRGKSPEIFVNVATSPKLKFV